MSGYKPPMKPLSTNNVSQMIQPDLLTSFFDGPSNLEITPCDLSFRENDRGVWSLTPTPSTVHHQCPCSSLGYVWEYWVPCYWGQGEARTCLLSWTLWGACHSWATCSDQGGREGFALMPYKDARVRVQEITAVLECSAFQKGLEMRGGILSLE